MATELKIRLPAPHPAQQKTIDNAKRFNAIAMGEQAGKTSLGIEVLIASKRGALNSRGVPVAWFSPTRERLAEVRRRLMQAIDPIVQRVVSRREIELKNGNRIFLYSLDDARESFEQFGLIVVDDARYVADLANIWYDTLRETLRVHQGEAWLLSGAFGKKGIRRSRWRRFLRWWGARARAGTRRPW